MEEQKKIEDQPKEPDLNSEIVKKPLTIAEVQAENDRTEANNKKHEELLARQEELQAKQMMAGQSNVGQAPPKPQELTPEEYAVEVENGRMNPFTDTSVR